MYYLVTGEDNNIVKKDTIEAGYKVNTETNHIEQPQTKLNRNKTIIVSMLFKNPSAIKKGETANGRLRIVNTKSHQSVFDEQWVDDSINSGKEFVIRANTIEKGKYEFMFYRDEKVTARKMFDFY